MTTNRVTWNQKYSGEGFLNLPVFANPVCGITEQIIEGKTGCFLHNSTPDEIAKSIFKFHVSSNYAKIQDNCRTHVKNNFTAEKMISSYASYYSDILKGRSAASQNWKIHKMKINVN